MPRVVTQQFSLSTGHDSCAPTTCEIPLQSKMTIQGSPICVRGAIWYGHGCDDHGYHKPIANPRGNKFFVRGMAIVLMGDELICPGNNHVIMGNPKFEVG